VPPDRYRWIALSNTTLGMLMATINSSVVLIAMPDIFRGIHLDPLLPANSKYLLWMMMSFMMATAVLVVSFGRIGDIVGRVRMYNGGFMVFTLFSLLLSVTWMTGTSGATWMIAMRLGQGVGGALLMANIPAILTDAFPPDQRGLALGNQCRRGARRLFHRAGARRGARANQLAPGLLGQRAGWRVRHCLGVASA